jgi:sulfur carrier protein ThiS
MSELKTSAREISVHLDGLGVGERDYILPEGATLADLLSRSGTSTADQVVFIDGVPLERLLPLRAGMVVSVVPRLTNGGGGEPWRATIPALQDDDLSREYFEILEARRREDKSDADEGG